MSELAAYLDGLPEAEDSYPEFVTKASAYRAYLDGEGARELEASIEEAHTDEIFGVPIFVVRGERFWGHDRIPLLEERLAELGLSR